MQEIKVWLDDIRDAPDNTWIVCRTPEDFATVLYDPSIQIVTVSFDHDLGYKDDDGNEVSGYTCARWLEKRLRSDVHYKIPHMQIHSMNPVGKKNIEHVIERINRLHTV